MLAVLVICIMGLFYGLQYLSMEFADGAYLEKMGIKKQKGAISMGLLDRQRFQYNNIDGY